MSNAPAREIPPALPEFVWKDVLFTLPLNRHSAEIWWRRHPGPADPPEMEGVRRNSLLQYMGQPIPTAEHHAVAALCLYGQPFGFTQEDVDDERRAYHDAVILALSYQNCAMEAERLACIERARRHQTRAMKIAALLPPVPTREATA